MRTNDDDSDSSEDLDLLVIGIASKYMLSKSFAMQRPYTGASRRTKAPNRNRSRHEEAIRLDRQYFCRMQTNLTPIFDKAEFTRRFILSPSLYEEVRSEVCSRVPYFQQRTDTTGVLGATIDQNLCCDLHIISSGCSFDSVVDRFGLAESTINTCIKRFCFALVSIFSKEYLRLPTSTEILRIEAKYVSLGFPGAIACIDCSGIEWSMCPVAHQGRYTGRESRPGMRMEVYCDDELRIWRCAIGFPSAMNDVNVMHMSPFFNKIRTGQWPKASPRVEVNGSDLT